MDEVELTPTEIIDGIERTSERAEQDRVESEAGEGNLFEHQPCAAFA